MSKWKNDREVYESIGKFCVDFEQVCRSMEACIRTILYGEGLTNTAIQEILLSSYTADPLRALLHSLIGQTVAKGKTEEEKICSKIFGQLQELINHRNDLIHSKWYVIGMEKGEEKEVLALGVKLHANKKGVATKNFKLKKAELDEFIKQCREVNIMISLLTRCVMGVRSIRECFQVQKNKLTVNYEALKPILKKRIMH